MIPKREWLARFKAQLIKRGLDEKLAEEVTKATDYEADHGWPPEDSADEELSYWTDDGE